MKNKKIILLFIVLINIFFSSSIPAMSALRNVAFYEAIICFSLIAEIDDHPIINFINGELEL